jgi:hypothetical protein
MEIDDIIARMEEALRVRKEKLPGHWPDEKRARKKDYELLRGEAQEDSALFIVYLYDDWFGCVSGGLNWREFLGHAGFSVGVEKGRRKREKRG